MAASELPGWQLQQHRFQAMGSPCEIRLVADSTALAERAINQALADITCLEAKYSRYRPGNFLDTINQAARTGGTCRIDPEFAALLDYADHCYQFSDGLFDVTSGVLREVWDFTQSTPPPVERIEAVLSRVGWPQVSWSQQEIRFARTGMALDLGGIVKEYAADRAAGICAHAGIRHGVISLGGDMHAIGPQPDGSAWLINIRHPRKPGEVLTCMPLVQGALASSGDYERFVDIDGERYCHILSPKTGWPVKGLASVTVQAPQCVVAGSACTIAMLKESQGKPWLAGLGVNCVWMDKAGNTNLP